MWNIKRETFSYHTVLYSVWGMFPIAQKWEQMSLVDIGII